MPTGSVYLKEKTYQSLVTLARGVKVAPMTLARMVLEEAIDGPDSKPLTVAGELSEHALLCLNALGAMDRATTKDLAQVCNMPIARAFLHLLTLRTRGMCTVIREKDTPIEAFQWIASPGLPIAPILP